MLTVKALTCSRGGHSLFQPLDFVLKAGGLLQVVGENGAGKTTLLRTLSGILMPQSGEIAWQGQSIHRDRVAFQKDLFYLGHQLALKDAFSTFENLRLDVACAAFDRARLEQVLRTLGLGDLMEVPCHQLSRGQRQRLALTKFFLSPAKCFILDEPLTGLDQAVIEIVQQKMTDKLEQGASIVVTSHQAFSLPRRDVELLQLTAVSD